MVTAYRSLATSSLLVLVIAGCNQSAPSNMASTAPKSDASYSAPQTPAAVSTPLPTASIAAANPLPPAPVTQEETPSPAPVEGSAEWNLRKIAELKATPLFDPESLTPVGEEELVARGRERHLKVIGLATAVLAQTHADKEKELLFNAAVHALSEARLELALAGDQEQVFALYDDATSLFKRDPKSIATVTSAGTLIKLAEKNAAKNPDDEKWLQEYVNQTSLFALSFPQEANRSVVMLINAGKFCEQQSAWDQALSCYNLVLEKFPNNPLSGQVVGMARRLSMSGQPLQFSGPTADGGSFNIDDYKGKQVLITFWKSSDEILPSVLAQIQQLMTSSNRPEFVWVCLDQDETAMDAYLESHAMPGRQIFFPTPEQRGVNNPLARYYGVQSTPTLWLVDKDGTVVDSHISPAGLLADLKAKQVLTRN